MLIRLDLVFVIFFILLITFLIREMHIKIKYLNNPTDFDSGYRKAIKEVADSWNDDINNHRIVVISETETRKFIKDKLDGK